MSTLLYCFGQGCSNIKKNLLFSAASVITIAACVLLFGIFYCLIENVRYITHAAESTIGISVFFNEGTSQEEKDSFKDAIYEHGGIREIRYISADEAWDNFKTEYFSDQSEELALAFADDNPLANSDSFEIFLENIEDQQAEVEFIETFDIIREVNYADNVISVLRDLNRSLQLVSLGLTGILFVVSVFLISNTINMTAHMRRRENEIMKMIGATNGMIRAPFVIEGTIIGFVGAIIPIIGMIIFYNQISETYTSYLQSSGSLTLLQDVLKLVPLSEVLPVLVIVGLLLGAGTGFVVSFITLRKHLKV